MTDTITLVPVDRIDPGDNHRTVFNADELEQLGTSIRLIGQIEPVIVRPCGDRYQLVAGERRWRAHQLIGKPEIKAIIRTNLSDDETEDVMMAENTGRVDLGLMDEARAYDRQRRMGKSIDDIAAAAGVARFRVEWRLSLIDVLCEEAQAAVAAGEIPAAAALEIRPLDHNRQLLAVRAWRKNPSMGATAFKTKIVAKLLAEQNAATAPFVMTLDAWDDLAASVKPIKYTVPGLRKLALAMADELVLRGYPEDGPLVAEARNT